MPVTFTDRTTAGVVTKNVTPQIGLKIIQVRVPATFVWGTDSIAIDLRKYGANNISGFLAFEESTAGSIVITATGTTSVATGVLTFVSTGSSAATVGGTLIIFAY
jgi:hypothetical protein